MFDFRSKQSGDRCGNKNLDAKLLEYAAKHNGKVDMSVVNQLAAKIDNGKTKQKIDKAIEKIADASTQENNSEDSVSAPSPDLQL